MPAKKMIRVRAVPGRLYPHPDGVRLGHRGWLGWSPCQQADAEHTIEGAAGLASKAGQSGQVYDPDQTTSDMFPRSPDIFLRRDPEGALVEEDLDIRRALRDGDLERVQSGEEPPPGLSVGAIPTVPSLPRGRGR